MRIISPFLLTAALVTAAVPVARAEVPAVIPFAGRLADDSGPIEGTHTFTFRLYDAQEVGTGNQLWSERHMDVVVEDGLVYARLGSQPATPLDATILDGRRLYLEIVYDNTTIFAPRLALESVPYAVRAGTADMLGGYGPDDVQQAIEGSCAGRVVVGVGANGALLCEDDDNSGGTVQSVTAGTGLVGGGTGATIALAVDPTRVQSRVTGLCPLGNYLREISESGAVTCAPDANTTYAALAGGGITVNGSNQIGLLGSCSSGQVLKAGPSGWGCANDIDTDTDTNTTYSALAGGGVGFTGTQIGLAPCASGQVLKAGATAGTWTCAADIDTDTNTTYTAAAGSGVSISGTQIALSPCTSGQVLKAGATAGTWTCGSDTDTNTTYTAAAGGGVNVSGTQIGLLSCSANQVLKVVGGAWTCAADSDTNTTYTAAAGGGVNVSGTQIGLATCATGQVLKAGAMPGTWTCAADTDTDTNTTYTAAAGGGVAINGTQIGLATCATGQVLKAGATAGTWSCAADADAVEVDAAIGNEITNATDTTLTRSGAGTAASPFTLGLNLAHANTWTGGQSFQGGAGFPNGGVWGSNGLDLGTGVNQMTVNVLKLQTHVPGQYLHTIMANSWTTQEGDYLYLGSTGATPSTSQSAMVLSLNRGVVFGLGTENGVGSNGYGIGQEWMNIERDGDIQIGTGSTGCVRNRGGQLIAGTCSSDRRFKKDIEPFAPVLRKLVELDPVHWTWRNDEFPDHGFGTERSYGLVAQDVERVLPELVTEDAAGYKAVHYSKLPLLMLRGMKELDTADRDAADRIAALERRIAVLEAALPSAHASSPAPGIPRWLALLGLAALVVAALAFRRRTA